MMLMMIVAQTKGELHGRRLFMRLANCKLTSGLRAALGDSLQQLAKKKNNQPRQAD